jgi:hypothetical protein
VTNSSSNDDRREGKLAKKAVSPDDAGPVLNEDDNEGRDEGLCFRCQHRRLVRSPRSIFVRCALGSRDGPFALYPRLPVQLCSGFVRRGTNRQSDS